MFRSDNEPSILAVLRALKQETTVEGEPQSNGAAESSVNVVKGHVTSIKLAVESASVSVLCATSIHRRFYVGRDGKTAYERGAPFGSVVDASAAIQPSSGPFDSRFEQGRYLGPMDGDRIQHLLALSVEVVDQARGSELASKCTGSRMTVELGLELLCCSHTRQSFYLHA